MDAKEFEKIVGHPPEHDDLERANCPHSGKKGHWMCGICRNCGQPRLVCGNTDQIPEEQVSDELEVIAGPCTDKSVN